MNKIAVISLHSWERQQLAAIWRFFPFDDLTGWFHLCTGPDSAEDLPSHPTFTAKAFSGKDPLSAMLKYLHEEGITDFCFASFASERLWGRATDSPSATVFLGGNLCVADLSQLGDGPASRVEEICQALELHPAILRSEAECLGIPANSSLYVDFGAFRRDSNGELLCTQNRDLVAAICHSHPASFNLLHFRPGQQASNLGLEEDHTDYLSTLNRLRQAAVNAQAKTAERRSGLPSANQASYSLFAQYYDSYMSHVNYEQWVDLILSWHKRVAGAAPKRILELACGTANASEILVFRGLKVDACDISPYMLHVADSKPFKPSLFLNALTDPIPEGGYDLIFCLFDSFNYLVKKSEAAQLLKNAFQALNPGGTFIFDISTLRNSLENFADNTSFTRVRDGYLVQISSFEPLTYRQITHFFLFRTKFDAYDRFEERHVQRVYRTSELVELCAASKLELRAIFAPETRPNLLTRDPDDLDNRYFRLFFMLQKPS